MKFFAGLVGALALASSAQAVTYDAFTSFNGTQGAGGFIYLKLPGTPAVMPSQLTAPTGGCIVTAVACLQDGGALPGVYKSLTTFNEGTYKVPNDQLLLHPGVASSVAIFFLAPVAGEYDWTASFNVLDNSPSGVTLASITNVSGMGVGTPLGVLNANSKTLTRSGTITLAQGQLIGVSIGPQGNYSNDSTGVNFTLTRADVPEPATWAMMIVGFGLAGAAMRRKAALA